MKAQNYEDSVAITRDIHWVGFFDKKASLHCNPYLLLDEDEAVIFDPGSIPHFPIVMRKIIDVVNPRAISTIVVCHQDPDCCGNLAVVEDVIESENLRIVTSSVCSRLVRHYGLKANLYISEENEDSLQLSSGRTLRFIKLPFLHSPGAIATYDEKTKTLFSGDFLGGVSKDWHLFAQEGYLEAMSAFHSAYMPSNAIVRHGLENLEKYSIDRVLPQHGSVLEGKQIKEAFALLRDLECGLDKREG